MGAKRAEVKEAAEAERKRRLRKQEGQAQSSINYNQPQIWPVDVSERHFLTWIALSSHLWTYLPRFSPYMGWGERRVQGLD